MNFKKLIQKVAMIILFASSLTLYAGGILSKIVNRNADTTSLSNIPPEITQEIMRYLDVKSLSKLTAMNKDLRANALVVIEELKSRSLTPPEQADINTVFLRAIKKRDYRTANIARDLHANVSPKFDITSRGPLSWHLLHQAVKYSNIVLLQEVLDKGIYFDIEEEGETPLQIAAVRGDRESARRLLESRAKRFSGCCPLDEGDCHDLPLLNCSSTEEMKAFLKATDKALRKAYYEKRRAGDLKWRAELPLRAKIFENLFILFFGPTHYIPFSRPSSR